MEISKLKDENMDNFFEAVLTMKSIDDCYKFFEDICTVNELKSISQRFAVAKMLNDKCVYSCKNRRIYCYNKPSEPYAQLRRRRI